MRKMTNKAFMQLPNNHKKVIDGQPWAVVADEGVSFVPVQLDTELTRNITLNGQLWIVDYCATLGDKQPTTRATVKHNGGLVVKTIPNGSEMNFQVWQDNNGQFWYGDDWYNDSSAVLYPAYYAPF